MWNNLGLWVLLSSLYSFSLAVLGVPLVYPFIYLKFTFGVILACFLGSIMVVHFFSKKKYRLMPVGLIFFVLFFYNGLSSVLILSMFSFFYLIWSLVYSLDSYLHVSRKVRKKEKPQVWPLNSVKAVFYKEVILLWRNKILFSVLFSAVFMGVITGYIARFGAKNLLPERLYMLVSNVNPVSYAFFGIYVLVVHGAVFVSLSFFLNEENTLWLIRHVTLKMRDIVYGKACAVSMPFLCSVPFIAYYSAFNSGESLIFLIWFLIFSYLACIIICFPVGSRYVGKKSDILLLYSISL
ncbi:MAG: hypothetical protein V5A68_03695, partial [Candidatus Thermoplasmatota archaeon]